MRYLAIDYGDKRTGLAVGDDVTGLVQPLRVVNIPRGPQLLAALVAAIKDIAPDAVVVGLPLNMDGTESERTRIARAEAAALAAVSPVPLHLQDERLSSFDAEQRLNRSGRTHGQKKAIRDALAACAILEDFLPKPR